jgi:multidrug efflux pump subunit AcrB
MSGIPGLIFKQFGWTAVFAVLVSLLVARVLTPMMAAYFLKPHAVTNEDGPAMRRYLAFVQWCLTHRKTAIAATAAFFFGSLALVPLLPTGFIPAQDRGFTRVSMELPPGSSAASTLALTEAARRAIADVAGIASVFATVGEGMQTATGPAQAGEVRKGVLTLTFTERGTRPSQLEIENAVRERLEQVPGARFSLGGGGAPGEKLQMVLASDNVPALKATAQALERDLRGLKACPL